MEEDISPDVNILPQEYSEESYVPETPYDIKNLLGEGSFGKVYAIQWNGKPKALKVVPKVNDLKDLILEKELELVQYIKTKYPSCTINLLCYDEVKQDERNFYLISDIMDNDVFILLENDILNICEYIGIIYDIAVQVLNGLYYLHKINIFHNDIKPENILFKANKDGTITYKIADFGLACVNPCSGKIGTYEYSYPNKKEITSNDDLFALAVTLYNLLFQEYYIQRSDSSKKYYVEQYLYAKTNLNKMLEKIKTKCDQTTYHKFYKIKSFLDFMLNPYPTTLVDVKYTQKKYFS